MSYQTQRLLRMLTLIKDLWVKSLQSAVGGLTREYSDHLTASSRLDLYSAAMNHALEELPSLDECSRPYGYW